VDICAILKEDEPDCPGRVKGAWLEQFGTFEGLNQAVAASALDQVSFSQENNIYLGELLYRYTPCLASDETRSEGSAGQRSIVLYTAITTEWCRRQVTALVTTGVKPDAAEIELALRVWAPLPTRLLEVWKWFLGTEWRA